MRNLLQCGRFSFRLEGQALVMGILNVTPDSFSDGGRYGTLEFAISRAEEMAGSGVDLIDIGGESTRPGSPSVPVEEELRRVMPAVYALQGLGKALSVDTCKPQVMREAIIAGADMINDINGFRAPGAVDAVKDSDCGLCIMHMQGTPQDMQAQPVYQDVVREVIDFLRGRVDALLEHNYALLRGTARIEQELGLPVLIGLSRKSMIGAVTGRPVEERLSGSIAGTLAAVAHGAKIVRVHDVAETVDALKVWRAAMIN
jgi:dihydropteroate synthase